MVMIKDISDPYHQAPNLRMSRDHGLAVAFTVCKFSSKESAFLLGSTKNTDSGRSQEDAR